VFSFVRPVHPKTDPNRKNDVYVSEEVVISKNSQYLINMVTNDENAFVEVHDIPTRRKKLEFPCNTGQIAVCPESKIILVAEKSHHHVVAYSIETGKKIHTYKTHKKSTTISISEDGKLFACGFSDGTVKVYSLAMEDELHDFK